MLNKSGGVKIFSPNFIKNKWCTEEEFTVNIDVRISSRTAFVDENIKLHIS